MKHTLIALAATLAFAGMAAADPIEGTWQTQPDEGRVGHIQITPCGSGFCGTKVRTFDTAGTVVQSPTDGAQIVRSMVPQGGGRYSGEVYRPSNQKVYSGKAEVSGNQMTLSGCVAGGLICKSQTWVKVQ